MTDGDGGGNNAFERDELERFRHVVEGSATQEAAGQIFVRIACEHDDGHGAIDREHAIRILIAGDLRHDDIQKDNVRANRGCTSASPAL